MTTAPKLPEGLEPVAYLVTGLRSGEPSLCFEDERGDYGDEDHTPVFDGLICLSDAQAALQALKEDAARYRWLVQCKRVPWGAFLVDAHEVGIDAAIDSALALAEKEAK